jgi:hypothetical protein
MAEENAVNFYSSHEKDLQKNTGGLLWEEEPKGFLFYE